MKKCGKIIIISLLVAAALLYPKIGKAENISTSTDLFAATTTNLFPSITVTIFSSCRPIMEPGEMVELISIIEGAEGYEVMLQWQCDKGDGAGFVDVPGANQGSYFFEATIESLSYDWRLVVYYR